MKSDDRDVHTEHCCATHGCKYNDSDCPVTTGRKKQSFPCEICGEDLKRASDLRSVWQKFDRGAALSDGELEQLIQLNKQGIEFLESRGETGGVIFKARLDLATLESFQRAR